MASTNANAYERLTWDCFVQKYVDWYAWYHHDKLLNAVTSN